MWSRTRPSVAIKSFTTLTSTSPSHYNELLFRWLCYYYHFHTKRLWSSSSSSFSSSSKNNSNNNSHNDKDEEEATPSSSKSLPIEVEIPLGFANGYFRVDFGGLECVFHYWTSLESVLGTMNQDLSDRPELGRFNCEGIEKGKISQVSLQQQQQHKIRLIFGKSLIIRIPIIRLSVIRI